MKTRNKGRPPDGQRKNAEPQGAVHLGVQKLSKNRSPRLSFLELIQEYKELRSFSRSKLHGKPLCARTQAAFFIPKSEDPQDGDLWVFKAFDLRWRNYVITTGWGWLR